MACPGIGRNQRLSSGLFGRCFGRRRLRRWTRLCNGVDQHIDRSYHCVSAEPLAATSVCRTQAKRHITFLQPRRTNPESRMALRLRPPPVSSRALCGHKLRSRPFLDRARRILGGYAGISAVSAGLRSRRSGPQDRCVSMERWGEVDSDRFAGVWGTLHGHSRSPSRPRTAARCAGGGNYGFWPQREQEPAVSRNPHTRFVVPASPIRRIVQGGDVRSECR